MRPPDENQPGFTRPNFMSASRRASGEDNILARLERDGKRGTASSWKSARTAWWGLASVAVFGLVGVLTMLTQENVALNQKPVLAVAKPSAFDADPGLLPRNGFAPLPAGLAPDKIAAAISDVHPERPWKTDPPDKAPPMVMLKPAAPAPAKPVALAARATPPKQATKAAAPKSAAAAPARVAIAASAKAYVMPPPVRAVAPPPAAPRTVVATAPARAKKPAPAAAKPESMDSDIALLSAIIMHASRHAGERARIEAAQCGGKKCPPSDPAMSLKITD